MLMSIIMPLNRGNNGLISMIVTDFTIIPVWFTAAVQREDGGPGCTDQWWNTAPENTTADPTRSM